MNKIVLYALLGSVLAVVAGMGLVLLFSPGVESPSLPIAPVSTNTPIAPKPSPPPLPVPAPAPVVIVPAIPNPAPAVEQQTNTAVRTLPARPVPAWSYDVAEAHRKLASGDLESLYDVAAAIEQATDPQKKWALSAVLAGFNNPAAIDAIAAWLPEITDDALLQGLTKAYAGMLNYERLADLERRYRETDNPALRERLVTAVWSIEHTNGFAWARDYVQRQPADQEDPLTAHSLLLMARSAHADDIEWLLEQARSESPFRRQAAADAMEDVEAPAALPTLLAEASAPGAGPIRLGAIRALLNYPPASVRETLVQIIRYETNPELNQAASEILAELNQRAAEEAGE